MQRIKICAVVLGTVLALTGLPKVTAQEDKAEHEESTPKTAALRPGGAYRLEFTLSELEDGKKVNTRSYSMLAQAGGVLNKLRIGARVPVPTGGGFRPNESSALANTQFQYMDVGMNIDCRVQEQDGYLVLSTTIDSSTFTQPPVQSASVPTQPVVRQLRVDLGTVVSLDKPTLVTSVDDPSSKRRFQLEVTATKPK